MSSKRHLRRKSCSGKRRFDTHQEASIHAWRLTQVSRGTEHMSAYRCRFWRGYHFGHTPGRNHL